jgi:hypothetical protein
VSSVPPTNPGNAEERWGSKPPDAKGLPWASKFLIWPAITSHLRVACLTRRAAEHIRNFGVSLAAKIAGTSRTRVYALRKCDEEFAAAWEDAEERAADVLEAEAWRRAVDGVPEPLFSVGKVVRDDDGQPLAIRRYSDTLLVTLLKARRPERFKDRSVVEHDISDRVADRLEAARLRALDALTAPMIEGEIVGTPALTAREPQKR